MKVAAQLKRRNTYSEISSILQNSTLAVPKQPTSSWCSSRVPKQVALTIREPLPVVQKAARPQLFVSTSDNNKKKGKDLCTSSVISETDGFLDMEAQSLQKGKRKRDAISCREYYCYKFQIREDETNQDLCRIEVLQGILDILRCGEREASNIGKKNFLPVAFIGGPRDMRRRYMDAIALVQYFGKPDLFITMTCNPSWPEIKEQLLLNDEVQNRPDLVSRVFRAKVEESKKDILKRQIFGKVAAFMYTIEFQKRGLPHAHFLIILANEHKLLTPESYDKFVCAELPDSVVDHDLYSFVIKHMMHGPCGKLNPTNSCMKQKGKCKFKYPKDFVERTSKGKNSYPIYKRRKTKECVKKKGIFLDNSWVVPYNPFLLCKYNCHMNVEVCSDIKVVKYIYKYICKGHDKITFQMHDSNIDTGVDEIKEYQSGRWVSPPEAAWRLFKFPISEMTPSVYHLQLHLQGQQFVFFKSIDKVDKILNNPTIGKTMLTEFFAMNRTNTDAMQLSLLYKEFPEYFVWSTKDKMWTRRKQRSVIGRVVTCHPTEGERYYLRLLLMNVRGPKSYEDLLKVDAEYCSTFRESAEKRGLLHCDNNLVECMSEAVTYQMPYNLRRLFATLLVYCNPANPAEIWKQFEAQMSEDFQILPNMNPKNITYLTLNHINDFLHLMGHDINEYKLIAETVKSSTDVTEATECLFERNIIVAEEDLLLQTKLNTQQRIAYDTILDRIFSNKSGAFFFFIDGPGATGKTFLYRALLAVVRSRGFVALATASSGVAASK
ncbi:uncharacterized protein LOC125809839 [Solanum verrucosum]|uniref:uncharacterized protein LOC125809839 n=1 Tax=Solanum verrucosum TaxID=315347 RepID=UPI0020D17424|nr:uncharacterized protein LOC125809839 [Solanum verrucosum]